MRGGIVDGGILLYLPGEGASQVHCARPRLVGLQPQHGCGGQLVVCAPTTRLLLWTSGLVWLLEVYNLATSKVCSALLLYALARVFQLYLGGDMMLRDEEEKAQAYTFTNSLNFNLPHYIHMVCMRGTHL